MTTTDKVKAGLEVRRAVLGDAHVDRTRGGLTDFDQEFNDMISEWAWGSVWTRPGLDCKTRSLLNIALLTALDRQRELGLHVQGALRTGCSEDEIKEVLMHCTAYLECRLALPQSQHRKRLLRLVSRRAMQMIPLKPLETLWVCLQHR